MIAIVEETIELFKETEKLEKEIKENDNLDLLDLFFETESKIFENFDKMNEGEMDIYQLRIAMLTGKVEK